MARRPGTIRMYAAGGYSAICVTDHYNRDTFDYLETDPTTTTCCTDFTAA
jgi:hypothetical protein